MGYIDIERLLKSVKVDDGHILLEEPMKVNKYGREFNIRQVNWFYDWDKFVFQMGVFLKCYDYVCSTKLLPEKTDDLKQFEGNVRLTISNRQTRIVALRALIKMCKLSGWDVKFMRKNFTIDDWIEFFLYLYIYNVMGVKKNLSNTWAILGKAR